MKKKKTLLLVFKDIKTGNVEAPGLKLFLNVYGFQNWEIHHMPNKSMHLFK